MDFDSIPRELLLKSKKKGLRCFYWQFCNYEVADKEQKKKVLEGFNGRFSE